MQANQGQTEVCCQNMMPYALKSYLGILYMQYYQIDMTTHGTVFHTAVSAAWIVNTMQSASVLFNTRWHSDYISHDPHCADTYSGPLLTQAHHTKQSATDLV